MPFHGILSKQLRVLGEIPSRLEHCKRIGILRLQGCFALKMTVGVNSLGFQFRPVSVELIFWNPLSAVELSDAATNLGIDLFTVL